MEQKQQKYRIPDAVFEEAEEIPYQEVGSRTKRGPILGVKLPLVTINPRHKHKAKVVATYIAQSLLDVMVLSGKFLYVVGVFVFHLVGQVLLGLFLSVGYVVRGFRTSSDEYDAYNPGGYMYDYSDEYEVDVKVRIKNKK